MSNYESLLTNQTAIPPSPAASGYESHKLYQKWFFIMIELSIEWALSHLLDDLCEYIGRPIYSTPVPFIRVKGK